MTPPTNQTAPVRGRCLCGFVRFEFDLPYNWCAHCHCESCRRACSAPMTTFVGVADARLRWTGGEPAKYASSRGVERRFCPRCGSQMAYRSEKTPGQTDLYAASLETPEAVTPDRHTFYSEKLAWLHIGDDLAKEVEDGA